jgi:hypothetical protein
LSFLLIPFVFVFLFSFYSAFFFSSIFIYGCGTCISFSIIGVGGILSGTDAKEKISAGAALVQIYSGFIYRGPELIKESVEAIRTLG